MQIFLVVIGIVVLVAIALSFQRWQNISYQRKIHDWALQNNCRVIKIEKTWFDYGPFWAKNDDQSIYRVEVRDRLERKRVSYFRIGPFHFQQEWYDEHTSQLLQGSNHVHQQSQLERHRLCVVLH